MIGNHKYFFLPTLLVCLASAASSCTFFGDSRAEEGQAAEPVSVTVMTIRYTEESRPQTFIGKIAPGKVSVIGASYPGKLISIKAAKGSQVKASEVMAIIDAPGVKSLYETSKATLDQARDALKRMYRVYATGSVTQIKLKEVETSYSKAKAAFAAASRALEDCKIKAPYEGVVGDVMVEEGVELAAGEPIFRLLDVKTLQVHASVPENEYSIYELSQHAQVRVDAVGFTADAVLTDKGVEASPLSHSYDFTFSIDGNTGGMMPGMVCKVLMASPVTSSAVIPSSAVRVDADGRYVWCIDGDGSVVKRHVTVSGFASDGIVIGDGLSDGDRLVIEGGRKISTGMRNLRIIERNSEK